MKKISILIVDDHKMIRDGLRSMLELHTDKYTFVIEEAETGEEGIEKIKQSHFDIVILDYQLPKQNGAETALSMLSCKPNINILALSNYDETLYIKNILKAGAKGYVLKNIDADELIKAITTILSGKNYYSNDVSNKLINLNDVVLEHKPSRRKLITEEKLSAREYDVLRLISEAYTNKQIADKLCISKRTVDKYRQHLLEKMHVNNTVSLLKQAKLLRLID